MHEISPPNAELVQKLAHAFATTGHQVTARLFEDESVLLIVRTVSRVVRIGLGVPW